MVSGKSEAVFSGMVFTIYRKDGRSVSKYSQYILHKKKSLDKFVSIAQNLAFMPIFGKEKDRLILGWGQGIPFIRDFFNDPLGNTPM